MVIGGRRPIASGVVWRSNQLPRPTLSANHLYYLDLIDERGEETIQNISGLVALSIIPSFLESFLPTHKWQLFDTSSIGPTSFVEAIH
jgi:hypothetical protein